jgi:hypothetical protein
MHGLVNVKGHDIRLDLEAPPDQQLFDLGSNPDAIHRSLAVKILIERCSKHFVFVLFVCFFLRRPEIADIVERYLADEVEPKNIEQPWPSS